MAVTLTQRLNLTKPTPGTGEAANVAVINANMDAIDNWNVPAAKMRRNAGIQAIATASTTTVDYDVTTYDTWALESEGAMADITLNRMNIRINGLYEVHAGVVFAANVTGFRALGIAVNGVVTPYKARWFINNQGSLQTPVQVHDIIPLQAGDFLSCHVIHNAGASLDLDQSGLTAEDAIYLAATWMGKRP